MLVLKAAEKKYSLQCNAVEDRSGLQIQKAIIFKFTHLETSQHGSKGAGGEQFEDILRKMH